MLGKVRCLTYVSFMDVIEVVFQRPLTLAALSISYNVMGSGEGEEHSMCEGVDQFGVV